MSVTNTRTTKLGIQPVVITYLLSQREIYNLLIGNYAFELVLQSF